MFMLTSKYGKNYKTNKIVLHFKCSKHIITMKYNIITTTTKKKTPKAFSSTSTSIRIKLFRL